MNLTETLASLTRLQARAATGLPRALVWPGELGPEDAWFTSPSLLALFATPTYARLDERTRRRLSFFEAVNFYSLNIHGEAPLIAGLRARAERGAYAHLMPYLEHMREEEEEHSAGFLRFCKSYASKVYLDRKVSFPRSYAPLEEDLLFFLRTVIFEEIADHHNVLLAADESLHPLARGINAQHHRDEARHLIFGRALCAELFASASELWTAEVMASFRAQLAGFLHATWREYYNPETLRDAGVSQVGGTSSESVCSYELMQEAWAHPVQRARRQAASAKCCAYLLQQGMLLKEPVL